MLNDNARTYYQAREQAEWEMARRSSNAGSRLAHETLARSYRQLLDGRPVDGLSQRPVGWQD